MPTRANAFMAATLVLLSGCRTLPETLPSYPAPGLPYIQPWRESRGLGATTAGHEGRDWCYNFGRQLHKQSTELMFGGYALAIGGGLVTTTGILVGPGQESKDHSNRLDSQLNENRNAVLTAIGAVAIGLGMTLLRQSDYAADASNAAAKQTAVKNTPEDDATAYAKCIEARAAYLDNRKSRQDLQTLVDRLKDVTQPVPGATSTGTTGAGTGPTTTTTNR
jgi:hypothetical protein